MIKKTFFVLFACLSLMTFAQENVKEEKPKKKEKKEKAEKRVKPEKPAKPISDNDDASASESIKPQSGEISIDFTANNLFKLFGSNSDLFTLSDDAQGFGGGIRFRYFLAPEHAIRVNFITDQSYYSGFPLISDPLGNGSGDDELNEKDGMSGILQQNYCHYQISIGFEKHFEGTKRLDTYAGGELMFDFVSINESYKNITQDHTYLEGYVAEVSGGSLGQEYIVFDGSDAIRGAPGMGAGIRLFVGADYYVFQKIYLGAELGAGVIQKWISDYTLKEITPANSNEIIKTITDRGQTFNVAQDITAQFRVGFRL